MLKRRSRENDKVYELKKKNLIELGDDSNLDSDFKPIKIGGKSTIMNLSKNSLDINGDLKVNGVNVQTGTDATPVLALNDLSDVTYSSGDLTISSLDTIVTGNCKWDSSGKIELDSTNDSNGANDGLVFKTAGTTIGALTSHHALSTFTLYEAGGASADDYFDITVDAAGATTISTVDTAATVAHLTIAPDGLTKIKAIDGLTDSIGFQIGNNVFASFGGEDGVGSNFKIYENGGESNDDFLQIQVVEHGATTISTVDDAATAANMIMNIDGTMEIASAGTLTLDCADMIHLDTTNRLVLQSAGTTFGELRVDGTSELVLYEQGGASTNDYFILRCATNGETTIRTLDAAGATGHLNIEPDGHVEFDGCAVGFDKLAGTFSTSGEIGDGNDSTDIDFRLGNKFELTLTDNISGSSEFINMIFPATSGNFLLVLIQDGTGSRTVASAGWVAYAHDETACDNLAGANGTDGAVRWAGGTAPTLTTTANKSDIISIYWDADNQTAFCVPSLNF